MATINNTVEFASGDVLNVDLNIACGKDGKDGADGKDGFSPSAKVTKDGSVATITITDKDGTTSVEVCDGKDGAGGGVTPARYITEIKTESLVDIDGVVGGTWTEYFYNDGTVEAEAIVRDAGYVWDYSTGDNNWRGYVPSAFGANNFNNPTNFTLTECWAELYSCSRVALMIRNVTNGCWVYPFLNVFKDSNHFDDLPDEVTCSYIIKAKGTA